MKRRKELYEARWPETKAGVAGGIASGASRRGEDRTSEIISFVQDTAAKTGVRSCMRLNGRRRRREWQGARRAAEEGKK